MVVRFVDIVYIHCFNFLFIIFRVAIKCVGAESSTSKNYRVIITSIKHEKIIDHLISKGILTVDDRQIIEANPAQSSKNRKLLEILLQGAQNGLDEFLVALRLDEVYTDLAEQIEKTNVELAEITTFRML